MASLGRPLDLQPAVDQRGTCSADRLIGFLLVFEGKCQTLEKPTKNQQKPTKNQEQPSTTSKNIKKTQKNKEKQQQIKKHMQKGYSLYFQ